MAKVIKIQDLAKRYKVHRNTIRNWMHYYQEEGKKVNLHDAESTHQFMNWCDARKQEIGR